MNTKPFKSIAWLGTRTIHFDAMVKFLIEVMNLQVITLRNDFAEFRFPNGDKFEVFAETSSFNTYFSKAPVAEFLVDNLTETKKRMEDSGISFFGAVQSGGGYSWIHFTAPDGNIYGLASGDYSPRETIYQWKMGSYLVSTDKNLLDPNVIHKFLSGSYWAANRSLEKIITSIEHSICFGVYMVQQKEYSEILHQIGFTRVISDQATFAYVADVFILEEHRGKGLSRWLMECVHLHPDLQELRRWILATKDAHGLYAQSGYKSLLHPERWMEKFDPSE